MVVGPGTVRVHCQFFGVSDTHTLDFAPIDTLRGDLDRVDAVLILTEMPRLTQGNPEIATLVPDEGAAALSFPALGVLAGQRRLVAAFMSCVLWSRCSCACWRCMSPCSW